MRAGLTCAALLVASEVWGQDTATVRLPLVEVRVTRESARSSLDLPFAVHSTIPDSARPGLKHQSLDEMLAFIPGVAALNRNNPAQDPRLFIRGFGSRSAFGVRGVRVLRDGIPLTLPDGQTAVDYMDTESIGRVEVIRGSASALYGNAAGGVIEVHSVAPPADPLSVQLRAIGGSSGLRRGVASLGGRVNDFGYVGNVVRSENDGYRSYASQRATSGFARTTLLTGRTTLALQAMVYDSPLAQDPGALTAVQADTNPRMADPFWVSRRVRKSASQSQLSLSASHLAGNSELVASVHGSRRSLDNTRPTFVIDLDRETFGASARGTSSFSLMGRSHRLTAGMDAQHQADDRRNDANCNGVAAVTTSCPVVGRERGTRVLDQRELVTSLGPFIRSETALRERLHLVLGARGDVLRFQVEDKFVTPTNPDDSGERTLRRVSPMAGIVGRVGALQSLYANVSTTFETPTASELTTQPDGSGGMNPDLEPQFATTYELGMKGYVSSWLRYDVAAFQTTVTDELIQFDVPAVPGRSYYRNAGRTSRRGAELGAGAARGPLEASATYSYSRFRFNEYRVGSSNFSGNAIPGIPSHQGQLGLSWRARRAFATAEAMLAGRAPVDDANANHVAGYTVVNVRAGATAMFNSAWLSPLAGVSNLFDRRYVGSVAVNAAGGKFYEPAPGRSVYVGLTAAVGK